MLLFSWGLWLSWLVLGGLSKLGFCCLLNLTGKTKNMKIEVITTEIYDFDVEKEKKRLKKCFKGGQLKRQMEILDAFLAEDFKLLDNLYHSLPRCEEQECAEQEYVGLWISIYTGSDWGLRPINKKCTIEFVKQ